METATGEAKTLSFTEENLFHYLESHDLKYLHEDAIFKHMGTGEEYRGHEEISALFDNMYKQAFTAHIRVIDSFVTEQRAHVQGLFEGKHTGEFAGITATHKNVSVPICVIYHIENGRIKLAQIYFQSDILFQQLGIRLAGLNTAVTYLVREIFQLKFGRFKEAKTLLEEAIDKKLMPQGKSQRILTDFTGASYRLIFEEGFANLNEFESSLSGSMGTRAWQNWYERFKPLVESSQREILKEIIVR